MPALTPYSVSVEDMMLARDERVSVQENFLTRATACSSPVSLLSFSMNIPGEVKQSPLVRQGFLRGKELILHALADRQLPVLDSLELRRKSGDSFLFLVEALPETVKRLTVQLEDSETLARLFDIDVLAADGHKLSREDFDFPPRQCLLCGETAVLCARSRRHSAAELRARCDTLLSAAFPRAGHFFSALENLAALSLLDEVYAAPKPGLVDRIDSGAHSDMQFEDFVASTAAIVPFLREMAALSYESCFSLPFVAEDEKALFPKLRQLGCRAEDAMFQATGGVNTHKGAIFTLGLLAAGAGLVYAKRGTLRAEAILDEVQALTADTLLAEVEQLRQQNSGSAHGETVLQREGESGVRGEAAKGFPPLRQIALPLLRQYEAEGRDSEAVALNVLLHLILHVGDTNVLYRGGKEALLTLRADCRNCLARGGAFAPEGRENLLELKAKYRETRISPGGCADLLSAALFLHRLEKTFR